LNPTKNIVIGPKKERSLKILKGTEKKMEDWNLIDYETIKFMGRPNPTYGSPEFIAGFKDIWCQGQPRYFTESKTEPNEREWMKNYNFLAIRIRIKEKKERYHRIRREYQFSILFIENQINLQDNLSFNRQTKI
jgi:hypothetical protein